MAAQVQWPLLVSPTKSVDPLDQTTFSPPREKISVEMAETPIDNSVIIQAN